MRQTPEQRAATKRWKDENRERTQAAKTAWIKRNRIKVNAKAVVKRAVQRGKLIRPSICSRCGGDGGGKIEGHHPDYSKPLEVIWVCHPCHHDVHVEERERKRNGQLQLSA